MDCTKSNGTVFNNFMGEHNNTAVSQEHLIDKLPKSIQVHSHEQIVAAGAKRFGETPGVLESPINSSAHEDYDFLNFTNFNNRDSVNRRSMSRFDDSHA